jgi:hypothetical protein
MTGIVKSVDDTSMVITRSNAKGPRGNIPTEHRDDPERRLDRWRHREGSVLLDDAKKVATAVTVTHAPGKRASRRHDYRTHAAMSCGSCSWRAGASSSPRCMIGSDLSVRSASATATQGAWTRKRRQVDFQEGIELALIEMQAEALGKIKQALARLDAGSYGVCESCGAGNRQCAPAGPAVCRALPRLRSAARDGARAGSRGAQPRSRAGPMVASHILGRRLSSPCEASRSRPSPPASCLPCDTA